MKGSDLMDIGLIFVVAGAIFLLLSSINGVGEIKTGEIKCDTCINNGIHYPCDCEDVTESTEMGKVFMIIGIGAFNFAWILMVLAFLWK